MIDQLVRNQIKKTMLERDCVYCEVKFITTLKRFFNVVCFECGEEKRLIEIEKSSENRNTN